MNKPKLGYITEEQQKHYYSPQKPEELVDALNDPIHKAVGKCKPAKTLKMIKTK